MKDLSKYNIVCVSDENYLQHAAVMLCSLFETNKDKKFNIFFLTLGIYSESEKKLYDFCNSYGSKLNTITIDENQIKALPTSQWTSIMYLKLFMPQILPIHIERCLFLDVDMVINDDIEGLYKQEMKNAILMAAEDMPDCVEYKPRLGLTEEDLYINSGVMLCDMNKWRKIENETPILNFTFSISDKIRNEQDVIAVYFKDRIGCLPIRWNMTTFYYRRKPLIFEKYLPELKAAKLNPAILHFACPIKPWYSDCNHPLGYLYRKYLQLTPWIYASKFVVFEQLTPRQRFNRQIRNLLNHFNIIKDNDYLIK